MTSKTRDALKAVLAEALDQVQAKIMGEIADDILGATDPKEKLLAFMKDAGDTVLLLHELETTYLLGDVDDENIEAKIVAAQEQFKGMEVLPKFFETYPTAKNPGDGFRLDYAIAKKIGLNPTIVAMVRQNIFEETHPEAAEAKVG